MRRLIPFALLGLMSVLALLALVVSVSSAARISSFPTPTPGSTADVAALHTVVARSLNATSFTLDDALNFQAPDRSAIIARGGAEAAPERVIGDRVYLYLGTSATGTPQWGSARLSRAADQYYGPLRATQEITMLGHSNSVVRHGNTFSVQQVVPADFISPGNPGQLLITYSVNVARARVSSVSAVLRGWVTIPSQDQSGRITWERVDGFPSPVSTYSNYDQVAPIVAPPATQTASLRECTNGSYLVVHAGVSSCSLFG